ncbi:MAG: lytic transglycosylase domain-containing protein [Bryobacteraceae bacterium]
MSLQAASTLVAPKRVSAVRVDARSGRLVRSTVVSARPVASVMVPPATPGDDEQPAAFAPARLAQEPPANVKEMVNRAAERYELEPSLIHSVIRVESNYNANAISSAGAQGLMQLIPSTARRFGVSNSFHPGQNIEGGARYLKYLMQLYRGDERLALAAYNAGEGAVNRYRGIPPYPETKNYVYQVGKRLGEARSAEARNAANSKAAKAAKAETAAVSHYPPIEKVVGSDGKEYYRTR